MHQLNRAYSIMNLFLCTNSTERTLFTTCSCARNSTDAPAQQVHKPQKKNKQKKKTLHARAGKEHVRGMHVQSCKKNFNKKYLIKKYVMKHM